MELEPAESFWDRVTEVDLEPLPPLNSEEWPRLFAELHEQLAKKASGK